MTKIRASAALMALACACVPATAAPRLQPWTTYQGNAGHTGYVPVTLDATKFTKAWSVQVGGSTAALQPVSESSGMVYVSQKGYFSNQGLYVLNALDGSLLWNLNFPGIYSVNPPAYDSGRVYIQTVNNEGATWLRAYEASSGTPVFQAAANAQWENYLAPTIVDRTVYVDGGTYGGMYSFNGRTGKQNWFRPLNQYDMWTPSVDDSYAYAYIGHSGLDIVDRTTGELVAAIADPDYTESGMNQAPALGTQGNALAFNGGRLISFDLANRKIRWTQRAGITAQPSVANGLIYVVANGTLSVRSETTGAQLWMWSSPADTLAGPVVVTDSHVFVSGTATTYAIDLNSHIEAWRIGAAGALALSEGTLYIAASNGILTAVSVGSGASGGANLKVSMQAQAAPVAAGASPLSLQALIENRGPSNATRLVFTIKVPDSFGVQSMPRDCSFADRAVTCTYDGLAPGQSQAVQVAMVPSISGTFALSGTASATQADPFARNNTAVVRVVVQ